MAKKPNSTSGNKPENNKKSEVDKKMEQSTPKAQRARNNWKPKTGNKQSGNKPHQPKKDSSSKRENFDNVRDSKVAEIVMRAMTNKGHNDFNWYNRNPELIKAAATLPFASILGTRYDTEEATPGIMVVKWQPTLGNGVKPLAVNQASDSVYSFEVHANSRNYNYTAPDVMMLNIAGMQLFAIISAAIRAYRTVMMYSEENLYKPDALLQAMGFDPVDLRQNLANMWFDINNFINQSHQIWVPKAFPLMERWFWLNSNVYLDSPGPRGQMIVFVQERYLQYSETGFTTGSAVDTLRLAQLQGAPFAPGPKNQYTWQQWKFAIQSMIDALINSEDRGIIYGDLLNAYGKESLYQLAPVDSGEILEPIYNAEVLTQIENLTVVGPQIPPRAFVQIEEDVYPAFYYNSADGKYNTTYSAKFMHTPETVLLNFHFPDQPGPEILTEATRLTAVGMEYTTGVALSGESSQTPAMGTSANVYYPKACGTELVTGVYIGTFGDSSGISSLKWWQWTQTNGVGVTPMQMMAFDWHPFEYSTTDSSNYSTTGGSAIDECKNVELYGDFDNYAYFPANILQKIHDACVYSLWGVPHV